MILSLFKLSQLDEPSLKFSHRYSNSKVDSLTTLCFSTYGEFRAEFCDDLFFFCRDKITHPTNPTCLVFGSACWEWGLMPGEVHTNHCCPNPAKSPLTWSWNQWDFLQENVCFWQTKCFCRSGIIFNIASGKKVQSLLMKENKIREVSSQDCKMLQTQISLFMETFSLFDWHPFSNSYVKNVYPWLNLKYFTSYSQMAYGKKSDASCPFQRSSVQYPAHRWQTEKQSQRLPLCLTLGYFPSPEKAGLICSWFLCVSRVDSDVLILPTWWKEMIINPCKEYCLEYPAGWCSGAGMKQDTVEVPVIFL